MGKEGDKIDQWVQRVILLALGVVNIVLNLIVLIAIVEWLKRKM